MTETCCALTGHRELDDAFDFIQLKNILRSLVLERGVSSFYCGMAIGFDTVALECLLALKKDFPSIKIIACIPCPEQADKFGKENKQRYYRLLSACDEKIILSERYTPGCMHLRNRYMVDNAQYLVAYYRKSTGGTAYTVKYAESRGRKIIYL
ncbi:MAG: DUF1273 family protein [Clostridia bacterium]|nr:DUF1273 family protein [Clostridia bacterium]